MSIEARVMGAMLRLARRREAATEGEILLRVGETASAVRSAIRRLQSAGLVDRGAGAARLTLPGLAVAVASLAPRPSHTAKALLRAPRAA
jgi:hypothetical protein